MTNDLGGIVISIDKILIEFVWMSLLVDVLRGWRSGGAIASQAR